MSVSNTTVTKELYSADLSELFKGNDVKLISDPEGYAFAHLLNLRDENPDLVTESKPLIVLGDLLDSAVAAGGSNILKMGNLAELKSNNLANLLQCRDNKNIHVMFGNRDLNKLKVLPLTFLKGGASAITINDYLTNSRNYDYLTLASLLKQHINGKVWHWAIPDLKHWYPFWRKYNPNSEEYELWQKGRHSESSEVMTCLERFFLIFGADNKDGTMTAHNLLYCIPYEVLRDKNKKGNNTNKNFKNFKTAFPNFSSKMRNDTNINLGDYKSILAVCNDDENLKNELELAAALVLTVFMRMIMKKPAQTIKTYPLKYDGLLYDLYTSPRTYFCAYADAEYNKRLLAFSHGGITKNLLDDTYRRKYDKFFSIVKKDIKQEEPSLGINIEQIYDTDNYNIMTHSTKKSTALTGGFYKKLDATTGSSSEYIHKAIAHFNATYKHLLIKTLNAYVGDTYNISDDINLAPSVELVKLLAVSSGFNTCMHDRYIECNKSDPKKHTPLIDSTAYSPIMPGIVGLRLSDNTLYCNDKNFVQFIGHSPQGFGVTIDLFESTSPEVKFKTYNINLDISNTTLAHDNVADLKKLKDNYLFMVYKTNGELYTHCKLHVADTDKFKQFPDKTILYDSTANLFGLDLLEALRITEPDNIKAFIHGKLFDSDDAVLYSTEKDYKYTPYLTRQYGFDNETKHQLRAYQKLNNHPPFSKQHTSAMLYGGKRVTKRNKRVKKAQTKKLKRK